MEQANPPNSDSWIDGGSREEMAPPLLQCMSAQKLFEMPQIDTIRLEEAQDEPEALAPETIIENLSREEAARLSKVRNIGIAVGTLFEGRRTSIDRYCRPISILAKLQLQSGYCSTLVGSNQSTKYEVEIP